MGGWGEDRGSAGSMAPNTYEGPWFIAGRSWSKAELAALPEETFVHLMKVQRQEMKSAQALTSQHGGSDYVPDPPSGKLDDGTVVTYGSYPSGLAAEEGGDQHGALSVGVDGDGVVEVSGRVWPLVSVPRRDRTNEVVFGVKLSVFGDDDSVETARLFLERKLTAIMHGDVVVTIDHFVPGP